MFVRIGLAAAIAAALLMVWGYLFWMVLAVPDEVLRTLPNGEELAQVMKKKLGQSGVYLWPRPPTAEMKGKPEAWNKFVQQYQQGPLLHLYYSREGIYPMSITTSARGALQFFLSAVLAGCLLAAAGPRLRSYGARAGFVLLVGMFATLFVNLGQPVWFHHPWDYHLMMAVFDCSNALLMGLVLAAIVKPIQEKPGATRSR